MISIGDTLRRERQRRNLELAKIAGELKISARFLEAMERDDFGKLPGGVFTRSFVRQYAAFLGLDADELAAEIERAVEPEPEVSQVSDKSKPDVPGMQVESGDSWRYSGDGRTSWPPWIRAGLLLVVLMLVCSGVYWWWEKPRHPVLAHQTPPAPQVIPAAQPAPPAVAPPIENPQAAAAPSTAGAADSSPAATQPQPVEKPVAEKPAESAAAPPASMPPVAAPAIAVSAPNPNATVRVGITADEAVWIRAEVNGKYQFSGTLQPHESRNIDADGEVKLVLGNAGGATFTLNGKPVGAVGPKGQIRTVQFTSGGFQIVSPAKPPDPLDRR
jgi:cytoskeleton protein RodZ